MPHRRSSIYNGVKGNTSGCPFVTALRNDCRREGGGPLWRRVGVSVALFGLHLEESLESLLMVKCATFYRKRLGQFGRQKTKINAKENLVRMFIFADRFCFVVVRSAALDIEPIYTFRGHRWVFDSDVGASVLITLHLKYANLYLYV